MHVRVEKSGRKAVLVTLIADDIYERNALKLLNDTLRAGSRLEIEHHVEVGGEGGVDRITLESHQSED